MLGFGKRESSDSNSAEAQQSPGSNSAAPQEPVVNDTPKPFREAIAPVIACGAGLFSDGYINNVRPGLLPGPLPECRASIPMLIATAGSGHRVCYHRPRPAVRRPLQELRGEEVCRRYHLRRHRRRPALLRIPRRPLVAHQFPAHLNHLASRLHGPRRRLLLPRRCHRHVQHAGRLALLRM